MCGVQTIDIDCAPGTPRPDVYIAQVLEGTEIPVRERTSALFGNWTWDYNDIDPEVWNRNNEVIGDRLRELYTQGKIRYASW